MKTIKRTNAKLLEDFNYIARKTRLLQLAEQVGAKTQARILRRDIELRRETMLNRS